MDTDLLDLTGLALDALPHAVLIAGRCGDVLLRNGSALRMLPAEENMANVLRAENAPEALSWDREVEALMSGSGECCRRDVWICRQTGERILADIHFRRLDVGAMACRRRGWLASRPDRSVASPDPRLARHFVR